MTKIIPTDKARQGHWGRHLLLILLGGLILALIVWGLLELYGEAIEPAGDGSAVSSMLSTSDVLFG